LPTDLWAIQPTGREVTDFKKPMSERVNAKICPNSRPFSRDYFPILYYVKISTRSPFYSDICWCRPGIEKSSRWD
jgi:hypothetical protein